MPTGARDAAVGRSVLLTRPAGDAHRTAARVAARGFDPVLAPLLTIETTPLRPPLADAPPPAAVLLTSGNALPAIAPLAGGTPLFAVGDRTAARARVAGWSRVESANGDASALAVLVREQHDPRAGWLLFPCAAGQGGALAAVLRRDGFRVGRRIAYRQHPVATLPPAAANAIAAGLHAAVFLSRSAATAFARLLPARLVPALAAAVALGVSEAALAPVGGLPWRELRVAVRPTEDDVLALL